MHDELEQQIEKLLGRKLVAADRQQSYQLSDLPAPIMEEVRILSQNWGTLPVVWFLRMQTGASLSDIKLFGVDYELFTAGEPGDD